MGVEPRRVLSPGWRVWGGSWVLGRRKSAGYKFTPSRKSCRKRTALPLGVIHCSDFFPVAALNRMNIRAVSAVGSITRLDDAVGLELTFSKKGVGAAINGCGIAGSPPIARATYLQVAVVEVYGLTNAG